METLLRAKDVAQILNLRPSTVYELVHRGVLPAVRICKGRKRSLIRFSSEDLRAFIESRRTLAQTKDRGN